MKRSTIRSRVPCAALGLLLATGLVLASAALADDSEGGSSKITCPDGQGTMLESKTCPATDRRPAVVVQRACCTKITQKNPEGKTRCKSFPSCPSNWPS
jgi:hypothetical protein